MSPLEAPAQDDLISLSDLIEALDGDVPHRAAMILRWLWLSLDQNRDTDIARLREAGIGPVAAL